MGEPLLGKHSHVGGAPKAVGRAVESAPRTSTTSTTSSPPVLLGDAARACKATAGTKRSAAHHLRDPTRRSYENRRNRRRVATPRLGVRKAVTTSRRRATPTRATTTATRHRCPGAHRGSARAVETRSWGGAAGGEGLAVAQTKRGVGRRPRTRGGSSGDHAAFFGHSGGRRCARQWRFGMWTTGGGRCACAACWWVSGRLGVPF